ncbi:MAG: hypothetical protein GKR91_00100 [Pseudomonadales bacterium]|nr:hypothetical protein [Pseudomonadales bacterium]
MLGRIVLILTLVAGLTFCASAQTPSLAGQWAGTLNLGGGQLRLVFHIEESDDGISVQIESVDQGNQMIPTDVVVDGNTLTFSVEQLDVEYTATVDGNQMVGSFVQFGNTDPDFTIVREN